MLIDDLIDHIEAPIDELHSKHETIEEIRKAYRPKFEKLNCQIPEQRSWHRFITRFDTFMGSKCKLQHNMVVRYLRYLKQITTTAFKSGLIRIDPFIDITLSSKKGHRRYLNKEELRVMISQNFVSDQLKETRDIFVFCCFTNLEDKQQRRVNQGNELIVRKERPLVALSV